MAVQQLLKYMIASYNFQSQSQTHSLTFIKRQHKGAYNLNNCKHHIDLPLQKLVKLIHAVNKRLTNQKINKSTL